MTVDLQSPPLAPRNGRILHVLGVCRSSTNPQDDRGLNDQDALMRRYVADRYDGPIAFKGISSRKSGGAMDRDELVAIHQLVEGGTIDLVVAEDCSRIARRPDIVRRLRQACVDQGTRLIAVHDHPDAAERS